MRSGNLVGLPLRPADRASDHAKHGQFPHRQPRDEDPPRVGVRIGRRRRHTLFFHQEQVVGQDRFQDLTVAKRESDPKPVLLGTRGEHGLLFRFGIVLEFSNEIHTFDFGVGNQQHLCRAIENLDAIGTQVRLRAGVSVYGGSVESPYVDFLCGGGRQSG